MSKNQLFNIYGARKVANGEYISITLIKASKDDKDDKDDKEYANILLKTNDKSKVLIKEKGVYISVKFLEDLNKDQKTKKCNDKSKSKAKNIDIEDALPF